MPDFDYNELLEKITRLEASEKRYHEKIKLLECDEYRYRNLFYNMLHEVHIWELVYDENGNIKTWKLTDANPAALKSWRKNLSQILGKTTDEIFPGTSATETFMPVVNKIFKENKAHIWDTFFRGTGQHLQMISIPMDGYFISTGIDITPLKKSEEKAKKNLVRLKAAISAGNVGLWDWDLVTNLVEYSPEWKSQIGYEDHEIANELKEFNKRVHPDDLDYVLKTVDHSIKNLLNHNESKFRLKHKDGTYRHILSHSSIMTDEDGIAVRMVGSHIDITDRVNMENTLQNAQKMEAIGTLAGGIAHDFNNILCVLAGNLSFINEADLDESLKDSLSEMIESVNRGTELASNLLTFARGGDPVKKIIDLKVLIETDCKLYLSGTATNATFDFEENLWDVKGDQSQLAQVFSNLTINSLEAMDNSGTITVSAENLALANDPALPLPEGSYVLIKFSDTGTGIEPEKMSKVFEPFYTDKGTGSGLGLATCFSVINKHRGYISLESVLNKGTTFSIYLPATKEKAEKKKETHEKIKHIGKGKVLVMDDQEGILKLASKILSSSGYEVHCAINSNVALKLFKDNLENGSPFNLVILDLTIPEGMGGTETLQELLKIDPEVKALLSSGYSDDDTIANYQDHGFCGTVLKPYSITELTDAVRNVL